MQKNIKIYHGQKIDLEETDEGLEEIDKAFENYMKYLEVQEDGTSTATDQKMQRENKYDIDSSELKHRK